MTFLDYIFICLLLVCVVQLNTLIYEDHLLLFELSQYDYKWKREAGMRRFEHVTLTALKIEEGTRSHMPGVSSNWKSQGWRPSSRTSRGNATALILWFYLNKTKFRILISVWCGGWARQGRVMGKKWGNCNWTIIKEILISRIVG